MPMWSRVARDDPKSRRKTLVAIAEVGRGSDPNAVTSRLVVLVLDARGFSVTTLATTRSSVGGERALTLMADALQHR